ncbi:MULTISPECIES: DJ-1/PfpI family protein [unclassified Mycoplasma]|uniref:DJ-1/PfpI family protein n=1 Tax=unclassified Mycoplasma TaxID=2683645 RepID=UPI00211C392D|nr:MULTISPECIES: DJ-1/PfpI family protein [unclassified Mycoplasma]UUM19772.1 DJ-1/PfpI family protein [Mycoplasma sp. 1578d]UUM24755.1 DJ-1/PfpI family protein [Mycoplasma sp. 3686d]
MKILVILENKFNDVELVTPLSCLRRADPDIVVDYYHPTEKSILSQYKVFAINNIKNNVNLADYDLLFIPGGFAAQLLRTNEQALKLISSFNGPIAAICDTPNTLREHNLIDHNTSYSAYPSTWSEPFKSKNYQQDYVTNLLKEKHLITARCADAAMELGYELVEHFYGKEALEKVHLAMRTTK